jgi:G3E family GTPase
MSDFDLHKAALARDLDKVRSLLESGADPLARDERGNTPLSIVAGHASVLCSCAMGDASGLQELSAKSEAVARELRLAMRSRRVPVTIVTGFLGSGKSTLVNGLLARGGRASGTRVAVVENEAGAVGIDGALLVREAAETIIEVNEGCLCCKVRGDLIEAFRGLMVRGGVDAVVVETSGLADVVPVAQTFFLENEVVDHFRLEGLLCVVDARNFEKTVADDPAALRQVAFADRVIINKMDLGSDELAASAERLISSVNPTALVVRTTRCAGVDWLLGKEAATEGARPEEVVRGLLAAPAVPHSLYTSTVLTAGDAIVPRDLFTAWLRLYAFDEAILRVKGFLQFEPDRWTLVQGVRDTIDFVDFQRPAQGSISQLVMIGKTGPLMNLLSASPNLLPKLKQVNGVSRQGGMF